MEKQTRKLDLDTLQKVLIQICTTLNMPIRKTALHRFIREIFDYSNSIKSIDFALLDLIEQGLLLEDSFYVCSSECAASGRTIPTATEEGIVKLLTSKSFKEEIRNVLFFSPVATDIITPYDYFKYVRQTYPALLAGQETGIAYMEQFDTLIPFGLADTFYTEYNDYPYVSSFFTSLFDGDSRLIIRNIDFSKSLVTLHLLLLPGKKRSYQKAHEQYRKFDDIISTYFDGMKVHIKTTPLSMIIGTGKLRRK